MAEDPGLDRGGRAAFENEILPANQPAVLGGLLRNWPAVQAGRESRTSVVDYFKQFGTGGTVSAIVGPAEIKGRFFYSENYQDFNFGPGSISIGTALDTLLALAEDPQPPAIALFDDYHNIACVVSGGQRFTVFPPGQVGNLFRGPLLKTPGGPPISVVDLREPDYTRFPKFRQALESAQEAVLTPGDAIYIPILWWHGVESLEPLNILVNYWWNDAISAHHKPILALMHSMVLMSGLPAVQRQAWRTFFDHFASRQMATVEPTCVPDCET